MKIANRCVVCGSYDLRRYAARVAPFISKYVFGRNPIFGKVGDQTIDLPMPAYTLVCDDCNLAFFDIRFDQDEMLRLYKGYRGERYTAERDRFEPGYAKLNPLIGRAATEIANRRHNLCTFLEGEVDPSRVASVLDYGGDMGQHIPPEFTGATRYIYEISGTAQPPGMTVVDSLQDAGKIEFIMLCHCLEHIPYPEQVLHDIRSACSPQSRVYIEVPLEVPAVAHLEGEQIPKLLHEHINFFTPKSLATLLMCCGYGPVKMATASVDMGWKTMTVISCLARPNWLAA